MLLPNVVQVEFRGRNDDGSQAAATWVAVLNTNWTQVSETPFRVRFTLTETNAEGTTETFVLQHSINGGTDWTTTTTSTAQTSSYRFSASAIQP